MKKSFFCFITIVAFLFSACSAPSNIEESVDPHPNLSHLQNEQYATPENSVVSPSGDYTMVIDSGYHNNSYDNSFSVYPVDDVDTPLFYSDTLYRTSDRLCFLWDQEDNIWVYSGDVGVVFWEKEGDIWTEQESTFDEYPTLLYEYLPESYQKRIDNKAIRYTKEVYYQMRQQYPYERSSILNYDLQSSRPSYFAMDETVDTIENYLMNVLSIPIEAGEEIENVMADNDYIYRAAAYNTGIIRDEDNPILKTVEYAMYPETKEHISITAQILFGEDCVIDYQSLTDIREFWYDDYYGIASIPNVAYLPIKTGHVPTVIDYTDNGDSYDVTIVYLYWYSRAPSMDFLYLDDSFSTVVQSKEECATLTKYHVVLNKGEENRLYLQSCVLEEA